MADLYTPPVRIHRVTTRRRTIRNVECPLEPELLIAEFAGELPPEVAVAVREHIATCALCGTRSRTLHAPYELIASLGHEPVSHVPDLRDRVRLRMNAQGIYRRLLRAMVAVSKGGIVGAVAIVSIALLAVFVVGTVLMNVQAQATARSINTLSSVSAAAPTGTLIAQTNKLVTIQDAQGTNWQVAEVIVVNEKTGAVERSLPVSSSGLQTGSGQPVAVVLSPDKRTVYEVTAPQAHHEQALVAFSVASGNVRFVRPLTYPNGQVLAQNNQAVSLAISPDGGMAYIGLSVVSPVQNRVRVIAIDTTSGKVIRALQPGYIATIPMPPPPGSLPASAFPDVVPQLDGRYLHSALGAGGAIAVSPDGSSLFDVLTLTGNDGSSYAVIQRIDAQTGQVQQELAIPGDFSVSALVMGDASSQSASAPLFFIQGGSGAECYVIDSGGTGPTLIASIALGGPSAPPGTAFTGTITMSQAADRSHFYISQHVVSRDGLITGNDIWEIDTSSMNVLSHRIPTSTVDGIQANLAGPKYDTFLLRAGNIDIIAPGLTGNAVSWLDLNSGNVTRLLGTDK